MLSSLSFFVFFFFNDTATPEIYTLSLHDALPIFAPGNGSLLAARFLSGLPHGAFFGVGAVVATAMVPPERKARSVSLMFLGLTVANVAGVPVATLVGQHLGWRATFLGVSVIGLAAIASLALLIPQDREQAA